MMITKDDAALLEETRVMSQLSERLHHLVIDGKKYTCYGGMVVPYSLGVVITLWAMTKSRIYENLITVEHLREVTILNRNDMEFYKGMPRAKLRLLEKMEEIMRTWDPDHFSCIVPEW